jgi:very-short-patch-repair endonuclease
MPPHYSHLTRIARELRRKQTPAESLLWDRLRNRKLAGLKFKRQHRVGRFIVDFYCAELELIVELEGGIHDRPDQRVYDGLRVEDLEARGLRVLRIRNQEVLGDAEGVLRKILALTPSPLPISGEGCRGEGDYARNCKR